jgi:hypothetical protein
VPPVTVKLKMPVNGCPKDWSLACESAERPGVVNEMKLSSNSSVLASENVSVRVCVPSPPISVVKSPSPAMLPLPHAKESPAQGRASGFPPNCSV